jgi:hypothetical protein
VTITVELPAPHGLGPDGSSTVCVTIDRESWERLQPVLAAGLLLRVQGATRRGAGAATDPRVVLRTPGSSNRRVWQLARLIVGATAQRDTVRYLHGPYDLRRSSLQLIPAL